MEHYRRIALAAYGTNIYCPLDLKSLFLPQDTGFLLLHMDKDLSLREQEKSVTMARGVTTVHATEHFKRVMGSEVVLDVKPMQPKLSPLRARGCENHVRWERVGGTVVMMLERGRLGEGLVRMRLGWDSGSGDEDPLEGGAGGRLEK